MVSVVIFIFIVIIFVFIIFLVIILIVLIFIVFFCRKINEAFGDIGKALVGVFFFFQSGV